MGKIKQYWQDQQDLKSMYDFNLQENLIKRMEDAIAKKQAQKAEEPGRQGYLGKPSVQKTNRA